ncbi:anhydro-N-acetylmuramic acid kinase [Persicitalea jodogahamensis]|uniref:Anhydro-N-acetylmuramic acid kinase n=2 Tax=Persicitalea jodogahamensis TaxID=402147 RepID=A0A8J3G995_9BACT|nr:anhydro-N-acetylmuramic acid kinase [Persicitalea jodogahamensis]
MRQIEKLYKIACSPSRRIIGLMSGTSLDGLDVALCQVSGSGLATELTVERFTTVPYAERFRDDIRSVFAKKTIDFQHLCLLNAHIGTQHGRMVLDCLDTWKVNANEIDLIASHGQTVYHAPKKQHGLADYPNATLQIGDGDHMAHTTGIITISDFRQKHIAAGGEGAPLAVYGDYLLFSKKDENRILLNMGGIANFTYLPGSQRADEVFTTDTGPGNTLLDAFTSLYFQKPYDENGALAASGKIEPKLLAALKDHSFFDASFPKTTGPEVFNAEYVQVAQVRSGTQGTLPHDLLATLTRFSAETIAESIKRVIEFSEKYTLYASGGGAHNPILMQHICEQLPNFAVDSTEKLGVAGDAKEAVLFAVLANETVTGGGTDFGTREGVPSVSMGKISFPR